MKKLYLTLVLIIVFVGLSLASLPKQRDFIFSYNLIIKEIPDGASEIRIWLPFPANTPYQLVKEIESENSPVRSLNSEKNYNNKNLYYYIKPHPPSSIRLKQLYKVTRYEYLNKPEGSAQIKKTVKLEEAQKYLKPDRLVTLSPRIKKLAADITKGRKLAQDKAKAIYDYIFQNLVYDKTIPGWGSGDTERVCIVKAGNCTDFHSLFISLARASGVPARFIIGFPIPKQEKGSINSYHCWAEFYTADYGWVPIDVSDAWKNKAKYKYFFGTIDENRVEFSIGRDIILEPKQAGEPLNYFIYPYVEIDGKVFDKVEAAFNFEDIGDMRQGLKGGGEN